MGGFIAANYTIFLVDKKGHPVDRINWSANKLDELKDKIEKLIKLS